MVKNPPPPEISIILPTYNRPEMLKNCIKAVLNQTFTEWLLFVFGDCCNESTHAVIKEFNDDRIFYYNNSFRFGEQSGGNNLGIALAKTKYIAFLNHDDIWVPDHLTIALKSFSDNQTNFYIGRSIFSDIENKGVPLFSKISINNRKPFWTFSANFSIFEPCSTWVIKTSFAKKVGFWKQSIDLHRRPIQEYLMRAWRKGAKFKFGEQATCIQLGHHNNLKENLYSHNSNVCDYLFKVFENQEEFSQLFLTNKISPWKYTKNYKLGTNRFRKFIYNRTLDLFVNKITALLYFYTGADGLHILNNLLFIKKGTAATKTLQRRTGESGFKKYSMDDAIEIARKKLKEFYDNSKMDRRLPEFY